MMAVTVPTIRPVSDDEDLDCCPAVGVATVCVLFVCDEFDEVVVTVVAVVVVVDDDSSI